MYGRGSHEKLTDSGDWREHLVLAEHRYMREDTACRPVVPRLQPAGSRACRRRSPMLSWPSARAIVGGDSGKAAR